MRAKPWLAAGLLLLLAALACSKGEKADDLAGLMKASAKPAAAPVGATTDLKQLVECCDENARAMGAECCNRLEQLLQAQMAAKGQGQGMGQGMPGMPPGMAGGPGFKSGRPAKIDPEIAAKWPKVKLAVGPKSGPGKELVIVVGQKAKAEGTPLEIEVDAFAPNFKMTGDAIVSDGAEASNPAAKVVIREAGKPDWSGWLFAKMPDVHAYPNDALRVVLLEGVAK